MKVNPTAVAGRHDLIYYDLRAQQFCKLFIVLQPVARRAEGVNKHDCVWRAKAFGFDDR